MADRLLLSIFVCEIERMNSGMNKRLKIVADRAIPFLEGVLDPWADVERIAGSAISASDVREADALILRTRTRCDAALLEGSGVRLIATATIGFDHIDLDYCRRRGIRVATAAGCNARGVLQWVAGVLVRLSERQGWHPSERTLGIVGVGHVGSLVRHYAASWGFRVLCCDPPREERERAGFLPVEEVARRSDLITFHTPLDATTRHLCGESLLARMPEGAAVINSSRGEVVDGEALLRSGHPYALDVWEHEPHPDAALLAGAEAATPHIAGYSLQGKANATALAVGAVAAYFSLPLHGWYPAGVAPCRPREIGWEELRRTIRHAFDCEKETERLKGSPDLFEAIRDGYRYREEYF